VAIIGASRFWRLAVRILIADDGSADGERVVGALAPWAGAGDADVHVLRVLKPGDIQDTREPGSPAHEFTPPAAYTGTILYDDQPDLRFAEDKTAALQSARTRADDSIMNLVRRHLDHGRVTPHVLFEDEPADAILRTADEIGADAIVVGTHARTGISRLRFGSVAEAVVRRSTRPVLVVGPGVPLPAAATVAAGGTKR
jgi:nucleotide-binding universal stress UspA family protein